MNPKIRTRRERQRVPGLESLEQRTLLAGDLIVPDHEVWVVRPGSAVIDGFLNDAAWADAMTIERSLPFRFATDARVRMMYDQGGLYVGVDVADQHLWADGNGGGAGDRFELEADDSFLIYIDPDNSRDAMLQPTDRAIGVNIANPASPVNGAGPVARGKHVLGDGSGGAPDVKGGDVKDLAGSLPDGFQYRTTHVGTLNNDADLDVGWAMELFIPWSALNMGAPFHAQTVGMNFDLIFDDSGGTRDLTDHRELSDRFDVPTFIDDHLQGAQSPFSATQSGLNGPANYAEVMFFDPGAGTTPASIGAISVDRVTGYAARLNFGSPAGTTNGAGHVSGYAVRYSASGTISSEADWLDATVYEQSYAPRMQGQGEHLLVIGLEPGTSYSIAVRPIDGAGRLGPISQASVSTLSTAQDPSGGKRIVASPDGRTLVHEDGTPHVVVGDHLGISWSNTRNLFPGDIWDDKGEQFLDFSNEPDAQTARAEVEAYFDELVAHGINTMRVYLELQDTHTTGNPGPLPQGTYWLEDSPGVFNEDMFTFVRNLLDIASEHGIYLILSPFDSFSYDEAFGVEGPWGASQGGPLSSINSFFQSSQTVELAQERLARLIDVVQAHDMSHHVIGWEALSEWDSFEWTLNSEGDGESGRETEMRRRANWVEELGAFIKREDPLRMTLNSTIVRDPRGPVGRQVFLSRTFDALVPHLYTNSNEEPINSPDSDTSIRPAIENASLTAYWLSHNTTGVPLINGEWGMTRADWAGGVPTYSGAFSQADDEALFRTMIWSGLAGGQAGMGLRIPTDELTPFGFLLTPTMRDLQATFARFLSTGMQIDFAGFDASPLGSGISASAPGKALLAFGSNDGAQAIAYVLHDTRVSSGSVGGATLVITGFTPDQVVDLEFWATDAGTTGPITSFGVFTGNGTLTVELPAFSQDTVVKAKARATKTTTQTVAGVEYQGRPVTFALDASRQPIMRLTDPATGATTTTLLATVAGFSGSVIDMTAFVGVLDGALNLAVTDDNHRLWLFSGDPLTNQWSLTNLTALIGAPGLTGDLTAYQPSWGTIQIAGLNALGQAVNYWFDGASWFFANLTELFDGPTIAGGLTAYVAQWDGLNVAGLNEAGELIVYWWAPGIENVNGGDPNAWLTLNMTQLFDGPTLTGQLDSYVTPWGGLNVAGLDQNGQLVTYWWAPGIEAVGEAEGDPNRWLTSNVSGAAGAPAMTQGVQSAVTTDGFINLFALDDKSELFMMRFSLVSLAWTSTNVSVEAGTGAMAQPIGSAVGSNLLVVSAPSEGRLKSGVYDIFADSWRLEDSGLPVEV